MLYMERNMVKPSKEAIFTGSQEGVLREKIRSVKDKDFNSFQELPRVAFTETGRRTVIVRTRDS